jgi:hypothetical protein
MKFLLIDAIKKTAVISDHRSLSVAQDELGLNRVDHGTITRGIGYVVYEFGFFVPVDQQKYAAIGNRLIAGNAVLYAYDDSGETVDFTEGDIVRHITFFGDAVAVESAIDDGILVRPQTAVNGEVLWQWPDPPEPSIAKAMEASR